MYRAKLESMPMDVGHMIGGKYRVERVLGAGGMGVVVEATHLELSKRVAIKFVRADVDDPGLMDRFRQEARASAAITSEHAVRVFDVSTSSEEGPAYIVMELLTGEDLARRLERSGPLQIEEAAHYVLQACEALAEAHSHGIVHRDLKPGNLFVARLPSGRKIVKVLDFGISKVLSSSKLSAGSHTTTTAIRGTPHYMSPEQLKALAIDGRADVWSLGIILYELCTGFTPFEAELVPQLCVKVLTDAPDKPTNFRTDMPPGLEAVILKCLEKEPDARYADVGELAEALAPFAPAEAALTVGRIKEVLVGRAAAARPSDYAPPAPGEAGHEAFPLIARLSRPDDLPHALESTPGVATPVRVARRKTRIALIVAVGTVLGVSAGVLAYATSRSSASGSGGRAANTAAPAATPTLTATETTAVPRASLDPPVTPSATSELPRTVAIDKRPRTPTTVTAAATSAPAAPSTPPPPTTAARPQPRPNPQDEFGERK